MIVWHNYCFCYCKCFILLYYSLLLQLYCFLRRNPLNQRVWICSMKVINYCFEASHINIFEDATLSGQTWTKTFNHTKVLLASCGFLVVIPEFKHTHMLWPLFSKKQHSHQNSDSEHIQNPLLQFADVFKCHLKKINRNISGLQTCKNDNSKK